MEDASTDREDPEVTTTRRSSRRTSATAKAKARQQDQKQQKRKHRPSSNPSQSKRQKSGTSLSSRAYQAAHSASSLDAAKHPLTPSSSSRTTRRSNRMQESDESLPNSPSTDDDDETSDRDSQAPESDRGILRPHSHKHYSGPSNQDSVDKQASASQSGSVSLTSGTATPEAADAATDDDRESSDAGNLARLSHSFLSDVDFVNQRLQNIRRQLVKAEHGDNHDARKIDLLEAKEAQLQVERDLAALRVRLEAARDGNDRELIASLQAEEAPLRVERDLAALRVRVEAARARGDRETISSLEAEEAHLRDHLLQVEAAPHSQTLVEAPVHPWMNMADATIEDLGDAGLGMIKLTIPTQDLMYLGSEPSEDPSAPRVNSHVLIVRSQLRELLGEVLSRVKADRWTLYAITGVPGIGKTMGSNYLLKRCYDMDRIVITHELNDGSGWLLKPGQRPVFLSTSGRVGETLQQYSGSKPLYLVDTGEEAKDSMHSYRHGITVLTASPNPSHFGQYMKEGRQRWISPWTKEELEVALPHIVMNYEDTKDLIWERFEEAGGSLRVLLYEHEVYRLFCRDRQRSIRGLELEKLSELLNGASSASNAGDDGKVSHKLIHVFTTNSKEDQQLTVRFASPRVFELLLEALIVKASDLKSLVVSIYQWKDDFSMAKAAGDYYELMFFVAAQQQWLGRSVAAKIWDTEYDRPRAGEGGSDTTGCEDRYTTCAIPVTKVVMLKKHMTAADVKSLCDPKVGLVVSAPLNWPAVDGWLYVQTEAGEKEIWLLQHTVASSHKVDGSGFAGAVQHARRGSWSDAKYRLVFVVPSEQVDIYRKQEQNEIGLNLTENRQYIHPWTGKPVQACGSWLPMIDGEPESPLGAEFVAAERFAIRQKDGSRLGGLMKGPDRLPTQVWELEASWILRDKAARALAGADTEDK